jgi:hypothetical protein
MFTGASDSTKISTPASASRDAIFYGEENQIIPPQKIPISAESATDA